MGKTKKLHFNEINGWAQEGTTELYPITSTKAVFNENNECLDDILATMENQIQQGGSSGSSSTVEESIVYMFAFCGATSDEDALSKLGTQNQKLNPPSADWKISSNLTLATGQTVYMTTARKQGNTWLTWPSGSDLGKIWSTPIRIGGNTTSTTGADGDGYNYMYCRTTTATPPAIPATLTVEALENVSDLNTYGISTTGTVSNATTNVWYDHPNGVSYSIPYEWIIVFKGTENNYQKITPNAVLWSKFGQNGVDGDGVEYIFKLAKSTDAAPTWGSSYPQCRHGESENADKQDVLVSGIETSTWYQQDDVIPEGWHDDPQDMTAVYNVQYVSTRKRTWRTNNNDNTDNAGKSVWGPFSTPTKWSNLATVESLNITSTISLFNKGQSAEGFDEYRKAEHPTGWTSSPNFEDIGETEHVFMITAQTLNGNYIKDDDGNIWSLPIQITYNGSSTSDTGVDVNGVINFIYYRCNSKSSDYSPAVPTLDPVALEALWDAKGSNGHDYPVKMGGNTLQETTDAIGWRDHPLGVEEDAKYEFFSMSLLKGDTWTEWSTPALWSNWGEKGMDGDGVEYIFCLSPTQVLDTTKIIDVTTAQGHYNQNIPSQDDFLPMNPMAGTVTTDSNQFWTDDPKEVREAYPYQYVSKRKKNQEDGQATWGAFCKPTLWSRYGRDGVVSGYILTCENDVVILDDQTSDAAIPIAANTKFYLQGTYDSTKYTLKFVIADSSTGSEMLTRTINASTGALTYAKTTGATLVKDTTIVTIINAVLVDIETQVESTIATRRHIVQIKDINSTGTVYKLIVKPNSICVSDTGKVLEDFSLDIKYLEITGEGTSDEKTPILITSQADWQTAIADIVVTIKGPEDNIITYHSPEFQAPNQVQDYYIINLWGKYETESSTSYVLLDSETFNCIRNGSQGSQGPAAEYYILECNTPSIVRSINDNNIATYNPSTITFTAKKVLGNAVTNLASSITLKGNGDLASTIGSSGTAVTVSTIASRTTSYIECSYKDANRITHTIQIPISNSAVGQQGLQGSVLRYLGNWKTLVGYNSTTGNISTPKYFYCNTKPDGDTVSYIDVVSMEVTTGTKYYRCLATHQASNSATSNVVPGSSTYWEEAEQYKFLATDALVAEQIAATSISAKDVVIIDGTGDNQKIVAGMTSSSPTNTEVSSSDVGSVRIWAGSTSNNNIQTAPFRVTNEGKLTANDAIIQGTIYADRGSFKGQVEATDLSVTKNGKLMIQFTVWTQDMQASDQFAPSIPVGTPVLKAYNNTNDTYYYAPMYALAGNTPQPNSPIMQATLSLHQFAGNADMSIPNTFNSSSSLQGSSFSAVCIRSDNNSGLNLSTNVFYKQSTKAGGGYEYTQLAAGNYKIPGDCKTDLGRSQYVVTSFDELYGVWALWDANTYRLDISSEEYDVSIVQDNGSPITEESDVADTLTSICEGSVSIVIYKYLSIDSNGKGRIKYVLSCTFDPDSTYCRERRSDGDDLWPED